MRMINLQWNVENQTQSQTLKAEGEITIGRKVDCTVSIPHQTVSRQHAALIPREQDILLRNLSETNPISLTGGRVLSAGQETPLENGDVFVLGKVNIRFSITELKAKFSFKVKCTGCGKVVDTTMTDCPWCGTSLAFGETFIGR
ncbi:MAG: FHA domain-containing protein [Anaerolineales bacterium]|jgi:pSer/pThr/pTyr-binding forkhead associated (FHA) protein|nr:FHA domain-containing protein [Anaerolineales bacterium]